MVPEFESHAERLCRDGLLILPEFLPQDQLRELQYEFSRLVADVSPTRGEVGQFQLRQERVRKSLPISALAVDPVLRAFAEYYWGKKAILVSADGYRIEPANIPDRGSFQWHHDGKRKQLRAMVLLTGVRENGQRMDYIPGSHRIWYPYHARNDNRFTVEEAMKLGAPVPCAGPAGTIVLFDTNGLHRGNRNLGPRRDILQCSFQAKGSLNTLPHSPVELHPDVVAGLDADQRDIARAR